MALVVPDPFLEYLYCKVNSEYGVGEEEDQSWAGCGRVLAVHMPGAAGAAAQSARGSR